VFRNTRHLPSHIGRLTTKRGRNPQQQCRSPWVWPSPRPARPQDAKAGLDCLTHPDSAWCRRGSTRRLTKRDEPHHELESGAGSGFWSMPQATRFNVGYARCGSSPRFTRSRSDSHSGTPRQSHRQLSQPPTVQAPRYRKMRRWSVKCSTVHKFSSIGCYFKKHRAWKPKVDAGS
jgi:hypothetical protein